MALSVKDSTLEWIDIFTMLHRKMKSALILENHEASRELLLEDAKSEGYI